MKSLPKRDGADKKRRTRGAPRMRRMTQLSDCCDRRKLQTPNDGLRNCEPSDRNKVCVPFQSLLLAQPSLRSLL